MRSTRPASLKARNTRPEQSNRLGPSLPTRYGTPRYCLAAAMTFSMRCCSGVILGSCLGTGCVVAPLSSGLGDGAGEADGDGDASGEGDGVGLFLPGVC